MPPPLNPRAAAVLGAKAHRLAALVLVGGLLAAGSAAVAETPYLTGGERLVFLGDSITQNGQYVTDIELFLLTRFPDRAFEVINHGISSETISGTSEPDHDPRRPCAHDRFDRDVAAWKPDVLVACFGMNDGNYHPFEPERFARYQEGIARLIERTQALGKTRLTLATPPAYDPYRRSVGDPNATHYGYKFAAIDYDATLAHYSEWLKTLARPDRLVADVHEVFVRHLKQRRASRVSFALAPDAVHPDATGHWLMAGAIMRAWNMPGTVSDGVIDLAAAEPPGAGITVESREAGKLALRWRTPLPFVPAEAVDPESIAIEPFDRELNRHALTVRGLAAGRYRIEAAIEGEDPPARLSATADELAAGVNLLRWQAFPTVARARAVRGELEAARRAEYDQWRAAIARPVLSPDRSAPDRTALRERCRPVTVRITITPEARP